MNDKVDKQLQMNGTSENSLSYVVSLQKPTFVTAAVVGNFRIENELELIIARVNRLEYFLVTSEGLRPFREIPIFGRIATVDLVRFPGEVLDSIVILTEKYNLAILSFDGEGIIRTRASGNVSERVGRLAGSGTIVCVQETTGLIALRIYERILKIVQWQSGQQELKTFNLKMEEYNVTDIVFLQNTVKPTISYLYQDENGRHLKTCEIDIEEKLINSLWMQENIETEASLIIPVPPPFGGLIIVGRESISYQKTHGSYLSITPPAIQSSSFTCYGRIDKFGERYLLGDLSGRLFVLLLVPRSSRDEENMEIKIQYLGEISIPQCLIYLDNSVAFVGSRFGDSQLIKLFTTPVDPATNSFISPIDCYPNISPIRDIAVMESNGQKQIVTASGAFKDGALKIIRSGIGIDEIATIDLDEVKSIFTLKLNSLTDNYMVVSFHDVSHLFHLENEEMEDSQLSDFDLNHPMIWAGNIYNSSIGSNTTEMPDEKMDYASDRILQITPLAVRLISGDGTFKTSWTAPLQLTIASVNPHSGQIIVTSGTDLYYLRIDLDEIHLVKQISFENEVACMDISPLEPGQQSKFFAVGFWRVHSLALYALDDLQKILEKNTGSEFLPRSVLIATMEGTSYIFFAMGDGTLFHYQLNFHDGVLINQRELAFGTRPLFLRRFTHKGIDTVFICSDRPTVIHSTNHKLAYSNVNLKLVTHMCPLNSSYYTNCLVLSDSKTLIIGTIDEIQKLHIRTIPLGETVMRVAYQAETGTIGILVQRWDTFSNGERITGRPSVSTLGPRSNIAGEGAETVGGRRHNEPDPGAGGCDQEVYSFCLLDANTFECLSVHELGKFETMQSLASLKLGNDPTPYFAIGTATVHDDEDESKQGRILIFQVVESESDTGRLRFVTEKEVKGCVFSIASLGNKLICSVNSTIRLFDWTPERELRLDCSNQDFTTALYVKTKGDLILVGDLMRSIALLTYKQIDSSFEEIARDYEAQWLTACELIDSDKFLGADNDFNLFCCIRDSTSETDDEKARLKERGYYYLGEMVNVFRQGTLVDSIRPALFTNPILYGTADGGLGAIVQLPPKIYTFFDELEKRIAKQTHNCIRIAHSDYRTYVSAKKVEECKGFIDGNLIESLLEMPKEKVADIVKGLELPRDEEENRPIAHASAEDVLKMVEDLAQIY